MNKIYYLTGLLITVFYVANANTLTKSSDTLSNKKYAYIIKKVNENRSDTILSKVYAKAWLFKAKKEYNSLQAVQAYRHLMYMENKRYLLHYSDSLLLESLKTKDNTIIGNAYLTKGIIYYDMKQLDKAVDNYMQASKYISLTEDTYSSYKLKYSIAHSKYYLGFYDEALTLFNECLLYFKEENDRAYLNTLHSIGLCYTKLKAYQLSSQFNKMGLLMSKELENPEMIDYFNHSEGVNHYFLKNYTQAIKILTDCVPSFIKFQDKANLNVANFYIAKSYWALGQEEKAVEYLLKVDKGIEEHNYLRPDLRENFELLILYYKKNNNTDAQLLYINKLLKADKVLTENFKYLFRKIIKELDTAQLLEEKNAIEQSKKIQQIGFSSIILILIGLLIYAIHNHFQNKKHYKIRFEELMKNDRALLQAKKRAEDAPEDIKINPDVVQKILSNLEKFENSKRILTKDLSINKLAAMIGTNPRYAAKIIQTYRNKKSIDYISGLKIDYVVNLLKNEKIFRKYTNTALAEEVGFSSAHTFSTAFKRVTGISVTYFIESLNQQEEEKGDTAFDLVVDK